MNNKLYKQAEFLRKFLAIHNIKWELKLIEADDNLCSYFLKVTLLNKFTVSNEHDTVYIDVEDAAVMSDNELDAKYELSSYALKLFMFRWDEFRLQRYKNVIHSAEYNTIKSTITKFKAYFTVRYKYKITSPIGYPMCFPVHLPIDYDALIQNCILDGIDLKDFPDIEDII